MGIIWMPIIFLVMTAMVLYSQFVRVPKLSKEWEKRENSFTVVAEGFFEHLSFMDGGWGARATVIHFEHGQAYIIDGWHEYNWRKGGKVRILQNLNDKRRVEYTQI